MFDLKLRTEGPLSKVVFEEAPWEKQEEAGRWISDHFDWSKTLGKDNLVELWSSPVEEVGSPAMEVRVDGERLSVSFFPNRK